MEYPLELAQKQIEFARDYTLQLLQGLDDDDWFATPAEPITHIAWQVGHLAMAEYGLCLFRQRGRQPADSQLMSSGFRKRFSRGSTPEPNPDANPRPAEILETLDRVHRQVLIELPQLTADQLGRKIDAPYAVYDNQYGALLFCAQHEMLHAGQIGLLRRLQGKPPVR